MPGSFIAGIRTDCHYRLRGNDEMANIVSFFPTFTPVAMQSKNASLGRGRFRR